MIFKKKIKKFDDAVRELAKEYGYVDYFFYGISEKSVDTISNGNSFYLIFGHIKRLAELRDGWPTEPRKKNVEAK